MIGQIIRYATVGLASNLALYLAYLAITFLGVGHKTAMTVLYAIGVCVTFAFNRNWTFKHKGHIPKSFFSYLFIYALGYLLNFAALFLFVDKLGYSHQLVQGIMVFLVALFLFILQKTFVFASPVDPVGK